MRLRINYGIEKESRSLAQKNRELFNNRKQAFVAAVKSIVLSLLHPSDPVRAVCSRGAHCDACRDRNRCWVSGIACRGKGKLAWWPEC